MRRAARIVGIVWIAACVALWLWIGFVWDNEPIAGTGYWPNWSVVQLLQDSKLGMTFVPIALASLGAVLLQWGNRDNAREQPRDGLSG
jgi:hypothetical protein